MRKRKPLLPAAWAWGTTAAIGDLPGKLKLLHHIPEGLLWGPNLQWGMILCPLTGWHCFPPHRGPPRSSSSNPDFEVVGGVPVVFPSYDEAVSGSLSALGPGYLASLGQAAPYPWTTRAPQCTPAQGTQTLAQGSWKPVTAS